MIDKEKAVELRKSGLTYKEIAVQLNCSFAWCAKHLSGVEKDSTSVRVKVDSTKEAAVAILKDALLRLEAL